MMDRATQSSASSVQSALTVVYINHVLGLFMNIISNPTIHDWIFAPLDVIDVLNFASTCRTARVAFNLFMKRAYKVEIVLRRFLRNPSAFRRLQRETGTLISGSVALQFLERTVYPESDLDLYTHPVHTLDVGRWLIVEEGYSFVPTEMQSPNHFIPHNVSFPWRRTFPRTDVIWSTMRGGVYDSNGIDAVYSFERPCSDGPPIRVQVISAKNNPFQCILGFHSSTHARSLSGLKLTDIRT
jgi:hypothetical protein